MKIQAKHYPYNFQPGDLEELLDDVEEVAGEQYAGGPESSHRDGIEPAAPAMAADVGRQYADEADDIQHLRAFSSSVGTFLSIHKGQEFRD